MRKYESDDDARARLADALTRLPENWVMCRDVRHAWSVEADFHVSLQRGQAIQEIKRVLVCMRCGTKRHEVYVPTKYYGLDKIRSHYEYPVDYQIKGVPRGNKPQSLIQQESYRRTMLKIAALQTDPPIKIMEETI